MSNGLAVPAITGLAVGIALVMMVAIMSQYPLYPNYYYQLRQGADYTPLLKLQILGLRDSYIVGEGIDFSVMQSSGGDNTFPELVMIKDLDSGTIVKEWNGTKMDAISLGGPIEINPATYGVTWSTSSDENPLIINKTGSYSVVAKHLFKTAQKEFKVLGSDNGDTSPEVVAQLSSATKKMEVVKAC